LSENEIVIFGTGEFAQEIFLYIEKFSKLKVVAFTIHKEFIKEEKLYEKPIIPFEEIENNYSPNKVSMIICVGFSKMNKKREKIFLEVKNKNYKLENFIHPSNYVWDELEIGENCIILENNVIRPHVKIGNDVIIENNNVISHHCIIKDHCYITSQTIIAGHVTIESNCFLGINCTIRNRIKIEKESLIGAGAVILKNTKEKEVYSANTVMLSRKSNELDF
jgi:sugar O-acyltransferase (sialic acid O-acetyltransferase NeuD family)